MLIMQNKLCAASYRLFTHLSLLVAVKLRADEKRQLLSLIFGTRSACNSGQVDTARQIETEAGIELTFGFSLYLKDSQLLYGFHALSCMP